MSNIVEDKQLPQTPSWEQLKIELPSETLIQSTTCQQDAKELPPLRDAEAKFFEKKDFSGRQLAVGFQTTCDPSRTTVLKVNGQDLRIADWVSIGFNGIEWKAGEGWPLYRVPDPKHDYNVAMKWNAYVHAILIGCLHDGKITYTTPYAGPGKYHLGAGTVVAFVNDDQYADNRGYFNVEVYGWT